MKDYNYNGEMFTTINKNDPMAPQMAGKADDVMGYGVAGYHSQGLRSYSRMVQDPALVQTVYEPYVSDIMTMTEDFMDFLSPEYFEDIGVNLGTHVRIKAYGGYKFVDLDPTPELWHGRTRTIGEVCTTMYVQRYASWLAWTLESNASPEEVRTREILKEELGYDFIMRVPAMLSYHATIMESSHIYGNCKDTYADIDDTDVLDVGVFKLLHNSFKFHKNANTTTKVILSIVDFAAVLETLMVVPVFGYGNIPVGLQNAYNNDLDSFMINGVMYKRNRFLDAVPTGMPHPITGEINTNVPVSMALIMGGKFARRTNTTNPGMKSRIVEKDYGTVVPFDLLNEVASYAYRLYFGVSVIDPTLVVAYFYAQGDVGTVCLKGGCVEDFYALGSARYTSKYNRRVANPMGNGETNEITFEASPSVTMAPGGTGFVVATPRYANEELHTAALENPVVYKEDMILLLEQYKTVYINGNGEISALGTFEFGKDSTDRQAMSTVKNLAPGAYTVRIIHDEDRLSIPEDMWACDTCVNEECPHFMATVVIDWETPAVATFCETTRENLAPVETPAVAEVKAESENVEGNFIDKLNNKSKKKTTTTKKTTKK